MRTIICTTYNIGDEVFLIDVNLDDVVPVKVHMIRTEWSPYGKTLHYDVYPTEDGKRLKKGDYIKDMGEDWLSFTRAEAEARMMAWANEHQQVTTTRFDNL